MVLLGHRGTHKTATATENCGFITVKSALLPTQQNPMFSCQLGKFCCITNGTVWRGGPEHAHTQKRRITSQVPRYSPGWRAGNPVVRQRSFHCKGCFCVEIAPLPNTTPFKSLQVWLWPIASFVGRLHPQSKQKNSRHKGRRDKKLILVSF